MSILNFLEKSVGKWFSQRTSYQLGQTEDWHQSDKTNVFQELLPADAEDVVKLCDRCHVDPQTAIGGLQTRWDKTYCKPAGSSLLVPLRLPASGEQGQEEGDKKGHIVLRGNANSPAQQGVYFWGSDETLVIVTRFTEGTVEERIWFAADNLRLRTNLMAYKTLGLNGGGLNGGGLNEGGLNEGGQNGGRRNVSSFYSEIRLGVAPPQQN